MCIALAWSAPFLKTFENMRKLDFFRMPAPAAILVHLGAGSLKKSNFLIFSKVLRKGADQAIYTRGGSNTKIPNIEHFEH